MKKLIILLILKKNIMNHKRILGIILAILIVSFGSGILINGMGFLLFLKIFGGSVVIAALIFLSIWLIVDE